MQFHEIINAKFSKESYRPMMQKAAFPVNALFGAYLFRYGKDIPIPTLYSDLVNYSHASPLKDKKGKWTHWENVIYEPDQLDLLKITLVKTYTILKKHSLTEDAAHFDIERIDFCEYGNSIPYRIKVINNHTAKYDFFYIKQADASRIYGLELEHLLTNNPINFLYHQNTLVEEHIDGIPGDIFFKQSPGLDEGGKIAIARAFVQFNECCFTRLLGDMRSYNFVVNPLSVDGKTQYRIRAIDFDQQCYEGRKNLYFPQFYKENIDYVELVLQKLTSLEIIQSQELELRAMALRIITYRRQLMELLNSMSGDELSENYKIQMLRNELNLHFETTNFSTCKTMGAIVKQQLKQVLKRHIQMLKLK